MAHRSASPTRLMIGDYVNVPQNLPPEVIRNDASDLEAVPDQFKVVDVDVPPFSDEKMACVHVEPLRSRQRVLGLNPVIFWVFMFLIVIILAAGIGGGLGAGLSARSKKNGDSSSSASSPAPSSTPISPSATASSPKLSCPANDTLSYTPISTSGPPSGPYQINGTAISYTIHCGYDYDASKDIDDMQWIPETNLTACIDLCSIFNVRLPYGGEFGFYSMCSGVTVTTKGTCQLKSGVEKGAINANKTGTGQSAMLNQGVF